MDAKEDSSTTLEELAKQHVDQIKGRLQETNLLDKERARERVRLKHLKQRAGKMTTTATSSSVMDMSINQADDEDDVVSSPASSASVTSENEYHISKDMEDAVLRATS